jgi:hypothetical protein
MARFNRRTGIGGARKKLKAKNDKTKGLTRKLQKKSAYAPLRSRRYSARATKLGDGGRGARLKKNLKKIRSALGLSRRQDVRASRRLGRALGF